MTLQYATHGDTFVPVESTVPALASGIFALDFNMMSGQALYTKKTLTKDKLVALPGSPADRVIRDIETFWSRKDVFKHHGLLHKRGVLMHGPPGSGKTSTLTQISQAMVERGGVVFYVKHPNGLATCLKQFREREPERPCVTIFEDVDNLLRRWGDGPLLPVLDGEDSIDNVVFIATTNYLNKMPPRLRNRPSRFDIVVEIGMPCAQARLAFLKERGVDLPEEELVKWVEATEGLPISHLKELVVSSYILGNDFSSTVARLKAMQAESANAAPENEGEDD